MTEAAQVIELIRTESESVANGEPQSFPDAASVGDYFRQGDVYITYLGGELICTGKPLRDDKHPDGKQLAPGTTQGSRHVLTGDASIYDRSGDALTGPLLDVATEATVTHPEHGDVTLPKGTYGITYQRAYAEELRRVSD